ncbi:MAG: class E sortase [Candidatus Saccharimonadales bacterium]
MRYNYKTGVSNTKKKRPFLVIMPGLLFIGGSYLLFNSLSPALPTTLDSEVAAVTKTLVQRQPSLDSNRLYVPKIGVDVAIVVGATDKTLEGGAWHRVPQNGDPVKGGNFVLAAHRFNLGLTPDQTRAKSPFYHIDKLQNGDEIYVDYGGVRYAYTVSKKYKVGENEVSIEEASLDAKLTMYSCDLRGPEAGREVVEALPVGTVAWTESGPKLKTN